MKLISPSIAYKDSFLEMAKSLQSEGHWWGVDPQKIENDFPAYIQKLENMKISVDLEPNQAPGSEFWILDNGLVAGRIKLNYLLTKEMEIRGGHIGYGISAAFRNRGLATQALAQTLEHAQNRKMKEILMTCDDDNVGSIRVIEKNGGVLKDKVFAEGRLIATRRYIIKL